MIGEDSARRGGRGEITRQLLAWGTGDARAGAPAFAALYAMLRQLASRALSGERAEHTLETTGLVNETFFRMLEQQQIAWRSSEHFIAIAAHMMRRILVDHARSRGAAKRRRGVPALPIEASLIPSDALGDVVAIHGALEALAEVSPAQHDVVELRFFGGLSHEEIARHLGVSLTTVERRWRLARAWLFRYLQGKT